MTCARPVPTAGERQFWRHPGKGAPLLNADRRYAWMGEQFGLGLFSYIGADQGISLRPSRLPEISLP